jgi:hypothetical protein
MHPIRTVIFLSFIFLGLLSPALGQAEVWRCPQSNGTDLFTNSVRDAATCQKYISSTELGYILSSRKATPPAPAVALPVNVPPYKAEPQPQAPEQYTQAGYEQESYSYYDPCSYLLYDMPRYWSCPGVYGFFPLPSRSPFRPHFHSVPPSGFHHGGGGHR